MPGGHHWSIRRPAFTVSPLRRAATPPRLHQPRHDTVLVADVLVMLGIIGFTLAMLGLIWGLDRI
ncbi:hypothetical protein GCM10023193_01200 [Planotetraspora kaengkrachanensis]|uniref:Uncharacterized protein n=1 Tax=Planotetraspora kaengkrachanensis TaxID=575193 RepID=A0A8J3PPQ6_9ACTN|nr:hypothetical protein Pka01_04390 [Planotetraspora kaengkrachanensis]